MSAFILKWPPDRYFAWLLNENAFVPIPWHYACDTDRCLKWWAGLSHQVPFRRPEVALCELTYYHQLYNIRGAGRVSNEHTAVLVPDEYYNELDEEAFQLPWTTTKLPKRNFVRSSLRFTSTTRWRPRSVGIRSTAVACQRMKKQAISACERWSDDDSPRVVVERNPSWNQQWHLSISIWGALTFRRSPFF